STRSNETGIDHLGIQVETVGELQEVYGRLRQADRPVLEEGETVCCYAKSEKSWITDPQGLLWESFLTLGESTVYGDNAALMEMRTAGNRPNAEASACCGPKLSAPKSASCCGTEAAT